MLRAGRVSPMRCLCTVSEVPSAAEDELHAGPHPFFPLCSYTGPPTPIRVQAQQLPAPAMGRLVYHVTSLQKRGPMACQVQPTEALAQVSQEERMGVGLG
jgi:hypothetical protein